MSLIEMCSPTQDLGLGLYSSPVSSECRLSATYLSLRFPTCEMGVAPSWGLAGVGRTTGRWDSEFPSIGCSSCQW